jgi:thioredoxin-like negative regulator of GroEL
LLNEDEALRLLSEIGYAAVHHGLGDRAAPIFTALALLRPHNAAAGIGRGLAAMAAGRADEAVRILEQEALAAEPDSRTAKAMLGLALRFAGRNHDSRRVLEQLLVDPDDDSSARLARELLSAR